MLKGSQGDRRSSGAIRPRPRSRHTHLGVGVSRCGRVGAAMCGLRPVVEIMFAECIGVALDQLITEAGAMRYL